MLEAVPATTSRTIRRRTTTCRACRCSKAELVAAIRERNLRSVSAVFAALAGGREDPKSKAGLASLLKTIWAGDYEDERDARFINDRVHANIQRDGTFSVIPRIYGGVTSAAQLRRIADVADKHQVPMVKITGGQRIDLLGITKDKLPEVWRDLGMPSATPTRRRSAPARPASARSSAATASATAPPSASRSSGGFRGSSRRTR